MLRSIDQHKHPTRNWYFDAQIGKVETQFRLYNEALLKSQKGRFFVLDNELIKLCAKLIHVIENAE